MAKKENDAPKKEPKTKTVTTKIQYNIKTSKEEKIALQNLLFGTEEKKLMVSDDFLHNMSVRYISKRMKVVNTDVEYLTKTKSPTMFFKYCDEVERCLEELIILEPYYIFKKPVPSIFKKNYLDHKPLLIKNMIRRLWKSVLQRNPIEENAADENIPIYDGVLNELIKFSDKMDDEARELVDSFYKRVHGDNTSAFGDDPDELEPSEDEQTEAEGEASDESDDDGFQELRFDEEQG